MSGIILLLILSAWFYAVKKLSGLCTSKMLPGAKKIITYRILFVLFFIAPVADDIIGGFQFRALCISDNLLVYDTEKVRRSTIQYKNVTVYRIKKIIPIWVTESQWVSPDTGEILIISRKYDAKGGWLSRFIGFPEGSPPYTFYGSCSYLNEFSQLIKKFNINKLEKRFG
jgi:hypothetical protein